MFRGQTAIITGASSGLGRSLAIQMAGQGAQLVLAARSVEALEETAHLCEQEGGKALAVPTDITQPDQCKSLIQKCVDEFSSLHHLVLNAGVSMWARFEDVQDLDVFRKLMEVNYLGAVYCVHPALEYLKKSSGLITGISSIQGKVGVPFHTGYVASKHALEGFLSTLRMELKGSGVDILNVLPGWIAGTNMRTNAFAGTGDSMGESKRKHSSSAIPVEKCCQKIMGAMKKRKPNLTIPKKFALVPLLNSIFPRFVEKVIEKKVRSQKKH